jgi:phage terminase large subunit-like protein
MEQEPGSSGAYTIDHFDDIAAKKYKELKYKGPKVKEFKSTTSKLLNSQPLLAGAEKGEVFYVEGSWNNAFIEELSLYPEGAHDDQMDAISNAYKFLTGKKSLTKVWGRGDTEEGAQPTPLGKDGYNANLPPRAGGPSTTFGRRPRS